MMSAAKLCRVFMVVLSCLKNLFSGLPNGPSFCGLDLQVLKQRCLDNDLSGLKGHTHLVTWFLRFRAL